jgi:hypothetical protein
MKKLIKIAVISSSVLLAGNASAWWGNGPSNGYYNNDGRYYGNGRSYNDGFFNNNMIGDAVGDYELGMDLDMKFKMDFDGDARSSGNGSGRANQNVRRSNQFNGYGGNRYYNGYNNSPYFNGPNPYYYGQPAVNR